MLTDDDPSKRTLEEARAEQESREAGSHPYLSGLHRPMLEELTLEELEVVGTLPPTLSGRYVRIGPNPIAPEPERYHWFAGDGMVHGLAIRDGRALWYRNRWIRSNAVAHALGEEPAPGPRHPRTDVVNTNVIGLNGQTWALVEAGSYPVVFSDDLEQQAYSAFSGSLAGSYSAHPHRDPQTGELHAIAYEGGVLDHVRHVVVGSDGMVRREEPIAVRHGPSIHDCALTDSYVVILDLPVTFSSDAARRGMNFPFRWDTEHRSQVGLLPKMGSNADIIWCEVDPCYVFHTGNAWEDSDGVVHLDVISYETMFDTDRPGASGRSLGLERWTVDPETRRVVRRSVDGAAQEFPRYDERRTGRPTRYLYTIAVSEPGEPVATKIFKHDAETGDREIHDFGPQRIPGEFVFVASADEAPEDGGCLIGLVVDTGSQTTDLVVLDAAHFLEPPLCSVRLPHRVPPGFHGNWIPDTPGLGALLPASRGRESDRKRSVDRLAAA